MSSSHLLSVVHRQTKLQIILPLNQNGERQCLWQKQSLSDTIQQFLIKTISSSCFTHLLVSNKNFKHNEKHQDRQNYCGKW